LLEPIFGADRSSDGCIRQIYHYDGEFLGRAKEEQWILGGFAGTCHLEFLECLNLNFNTPQVK
jgi:hypothetical protein